MESRILLLPLLRPPVYLPFTSRLQTGGVVVVMVVVMERGGGAWLFFCLFWMVS